MTSARDEMAAIFRPMERALLLSINETREAMGKQPFASYGDLVDDLATEKRRARWLARYERGEFSR